MVADESLAVDPELPILPELPVAPVMPVLPVAPVEPVDPVDPLEPVGPAGPAEPAGPGVEGLPDVLRSQAVRASAANPITAAAITGETRDALRNSFIRFPKSCMKIEKSCLSDLTN